ncbi:MAG: chromosome segregation protein, partial [Sphingomonadaceae bacterium]
EARERLEEANEKLAVSETNLGRLTAERAEAQAGRNQLERALRDLSERQARLARQLSDQARDLDELDRQMATLPDPHEKQGQVEVAEAALEDAEANVADIEEALAETRRAEAEARPPVDRARAVLNGIETEARTIRRMLEAAGGGAYPAVVEEMKVDRGFETALGAALGDDLDSPLDSAAPAHWRAPGDHSGDAALPQGARSLIEYVRAPQALTRALSQIGIVDSEAEAERLMPLLKPGQSLVTKQGSVWRWDGHVTGSEAPSAAALRLAQKNRLAELDAEADEAGEALRRAEADLAAAGSRIRAEDERLRLARDAQRMITRQLGEARDVLAAAERASGDLSRRRAVVAETKSQLESQLEEVAEQIETANDALADAPDLSELELKLRTQTADVAADRAAVAERRAAHDGLARENEARQRRITAISGERQTWKARAASAEEHIATLRDREAEARDEVEELMDAPDEFEDKRRALMNELQKAEASRREAADILAEAEGRQREADRMAATALSELAESREKRGRAEERLVSSRERRVEIEARIHEALSCAPHEVMRLTGLAADEALPDMRNVERELERLKIERERLGAVNLRAEEEQKELSERLALLLKERDDVIEAIRKLRSAIQNLNREGRERLIVAFDVVNAQFQRLFTHLFGGGTAELQLIESDDPLEAGLEILARPPGKKPQTMTLLSGGEQALTAMALIFAVFLTNPAPICVLDEVDAPLDDHNVERYCNLMDEMAASTETRFVIITHNPITMARMNRLFGVTMAEQGVSQLVSVDLQTAERLREVV